MTATDAAVTRRTHRRTGAVDRFLEQRNWPVVTQVVAAAAVFLVAARVPVFNGVEIGTLVGVALLPVWWTHLHRYHGARLLVALGFVALVTGALLTFFARGDRDFSRPLLQGESGQMIIVLLGLGVLLWARTVIGSMPMVVWFALGMFVAGFLHPTELGLPWKYDFGIPATFLLLAVAAWRRPRPWLEIPVAILMAGSFAVNDARSLFGLVMLAAFAALLQALLPGGSSSRRSLLLPLSLLALAAVAVYRTTTWAITAGLLGEAARQRTVVQVEQSGSMLFGGRPEAGASVNLIQQQPWGYGSGTMASRGDVELASQGMADIAGRAPDTGYVLNYMFEYGYTMHSTLAEFWINYGLPGAVFALTVAGLSLAALLRLLAERQLTAVAAFAVVNTVWNLAFSPTTDTVYQMVLSTALVLGSVAVARRSGTGSTALPDRVTDDDVPAGHPVPSA